MDASALQLIILPAGIIAVLFAIYLARDVLSRDTGTPEMQAVAGTIFEGAVAFIRRQYTTIGILAIVGAFVIGAIITVFETKAVADTNTFGLDLGWGDAVALGLLLPFAAQVGDLAESALKRGLGVKDSSGLVPGHGGLADRLDSLLFALPALYYYLEWRLL